MLPKVGREDALNHNNHSCGDCGGGENTGISGSNKVVRMLSTAMTPSTPDTTSGGGIMVGSKGVRRPISTKAARVTTIPLEPTFLPASGGSLPANGSSQSRPYLPYSASSHTKSGVTHQNGVGFSRWKASSSTGTTSEYSNGNVNYARSLARRGNLSGKTWSARGAPNQGGSSKSMPYLVPRTARQRVPSAITSSKLASTSSLSDSQQQSSTNDDKVGKKVGDQPTATMQLVGGMVMVGTGKPGAAMNGSSGGSCPASSSLSKDRVQVCRTKEEREKNPDTIRLDKRGVRVFPDIGGGEGTTIKLLSLQHNLITRLENVPLLSALVVLDLYDNRVERICGLQGLPSLRVLLLGKNRIKRIEGMDSLKRLEILDLHGNQLRYVDNLGSLSALRVMNLAGNLLRNIRNLGPYGLSSLTELNLKRNRIKSLDGLQKAPHLKKLLLANNDLPNMAALVPLRKLVFLNELVLDPNPLVGAVGSEYQSQILTLFPNLGSLDRNPITDEMKQAAKLWHRKKLEEEERRRMEEEKIREEIAQSVGPPGSREQVIYQARRRWESLRNFVKSSNNNNGPPQQHTTPASKKSAMKSMKKVVAVATEVSAKKKAELLYPPATLDLEEFPNGQDNFEQTESLLGSAAGVTKEGQNFPTQGMEQRDKYSSQNAPKAQKTVTSSAKLLDNPETDKIVVDTGRETDTERDMKEIGAPIGKSPGVKDDEPVDHVEQVMDNQCTSGCSARSNSAKVAIVRPLVHRSNNVEMETLLPTKDSNSVRNVNGDGELQINTVDEVFGLQTKVASLENQDIALDKETLLGDEVLEDQGKITQEVGGEEESVSNQILITHSTSVLIITEEDGDAAAATATASLDQNGQPDIQTESARVKSKLLQHLRSISLDSYPHPFLRPAGGGQKSAGDAGGSSINSASPMIASDDDGGGEEEDDNDNEVVQDYDCDEDDTFSIATSTCTTVTSGSTPRRSSTVTATTNRLLKNGVLRKQIFPRTRSQRLKLRDRAAKLFGSTSDLSPRSSTGVAISKRVHSGTGTRGCSDAAVGSASGRPGPGGRVLRRCDSAASLSTSTGLVSSSPASSAVGGSANSGGKSASSGHLVPDSGENPGGPSRKQGMDFLVEVEGKLLNIFGQGGLRHALTAFASNVTCHVNTAKFHYISYDSIIPFFGKLRQVYPSLEHFHFRANNLCTLSQLDSLSDLQGLTSLYIAKEGNPVVNHEAWAHYSSYRLSHWGLQVINGKEMCSEYRGGASPAALAKGFESLGFLALSCLPQTALTPLAKRLHMLHCFCCCSPSTSSEESNRKFAGNQTQPRLLNTSQATTTDHTNTNFCTAWDDDPVLLDVIGKEALVYCPAILPPDIYENVDGSTCSATPNSIKPPEASTSNAPPRPITPPTCSPSVFEKKRTETLEHLINSGVEIVEKIDMLERIWPSLMTEVIQEILMDFRFTDSYMKKELKKCHDITLANQQQQQHHGHHNTNHQHGKKFRH